MDGFYINPDIAKATTLSKEFYISQDVFDYTKEKFFASSWQFIGDISRIYTGDAFPVTLLQEFLDEPILFTRDKNNTLHCLSNVCTHRGNILVNEPCKLTNIRCKYHGRLFHPDGKLLSMPEFEEVADFPSDDDNLKNIPFYQWANWLFVSLNPSMNSDVYLKEMMDRIRWLPLNDFVFNAALSQDFIVNAHWALYCENYLEGFHIPFVHASLNTVIDYGNYSTELFSYSNLHIGIAKDGEDCFDIPESSPDYGKKISAYYFWIFPNMMFNFYPWGLSVNVVKPLSIEQSKVSFLTYIYDESKLNKGAGADLHMVEMEDEEVVENVQRGIRSRFYKHGRYSVSKEQGIHHFHQIIAEFLK